MSKTSKDKLPQYVYRTAFGVFRFRRNVPKDVVEISGRKLWYKVLGKTYKDAMGAYSAALAAFDVFVKSHPLFVRPSLNLSATSTVMRQYTCLSEDR